MTSILSFNLNLSMFAKTASYVSPMIAIKMLKMMICEKTVVKMKSIQTR